MLTLYLAPGSSSMAPHIALREAGAAFTAVPISFDQREQRQPAFLAVNPEGKVPALVLDDGQALTEVSAILFYLARRFPEAKLLPEGLEMEARALSWMSFAAATLHPASHLGGEHAAAAYRDAEHRLGGREWAVGERMSIADIHLFRLFWRNHARRGLSRDAHPGLWAHHDRMMARPAVIATCEAEAAIGYELPG